MKPPVFKVSKVGVRERNLTGFIPFADHKLLTDQFKGKSWLALRK